MFISKISSVLAFLGEDTSILLHSLNALWSTLKPDLTSCPGDLGIHLLYLHYPWMSTGNYTPGLSSWPWKLTNKTYNGPDLRRTVQRRAMRYLKQFPWIWTLEPSKVGSNGIILGLDRKRSCTKYTSMDVGRTFKDQSAVDIRLGRVLEKLNSDRI